jgi:hypothetical protein
MPAECPHCTAPITSGSNFCTGCGKAVQSAPSTGPRIVGDNDIATSTAGSSLMIDELKKQMRKASTALFAVGIIQAIGAAIFTAIASSQTPASTTGVMVILGGISAAFLGLGFWARKSPLPASIVGLVVYVSMLTLDGIAGAASGHPEVIFQGIILKAIIIGCLVQAVRAGTKFRALTRENAGNSSGQTTQSFNSYSKAA